MQQQQAESNSRIQRKMIILSSGKCSTSKAAAAAECSARASMARGWYPARAQRVGARERATRQLRCPQYVANGEARSPFALVSWCLPPKKLSFRQHPKGRLLDVSRRPRGVLMNCPRRRGALIYKTHARSIARRKKVGQTTLCGSQFFSNGAHETKATSCPLKTPYF